MKSIVGIISNGLNITELNIAPNKRDIYYHRGGDGNMSHIIPCILRMKNLQKLSIDIQIATGEGTSNLKTLLDSKYKNALFWTNLKEFKCSNIDYNRYGFYIFIQYILKKCVNLSLLELKEPVTASKYGYNGYQSIYKTLDYKTIVAFDNLNELILDIPSNNIGELFRNISFSRINLKKFNATLWNSNILYDFAYNSNTILNDLKCLLECQLFKYKKLNDIKFIFHVFDANSEPINLLYLMLINVFGNNKLKSRNVMNLTFNIQSNAILFQHPLCNAMLIQNLLDCLYNKMNHCFVTLNNTKFSIKTLKRQLYTNNSWVIPNNVIIQNQDSITIMKSTNLNITIHVRSVNINNNENDENKISQEYSFEELRLIFENNKTNNNNNYIINPISHSAQYPLIGFKFIETNIININYNNKYDMDLKTNDFEIKSVINDKDKSNFDIKSTKLTNTDIDNHSSGSDLMDALKEKLRMRRRQMEYGNKYKTNINWINVAKVLLYHYPTIKLFDGYNHKIIESNKDAESFLKSSNLTDFSKMIKKTKQYFTPSIQKTKTPSINPQSITKASMMQQIRQKLLSEMRVSDPDNDSNWDPNDDDFDFFD